MDKDMNPRTSRGRRRLLSALAAACALAAWFTAPASAGAETLHLGRLALPTAVGGCTNCHFLQMETASAGAGYVVPAGKWTLDSWSGQGGEKGGPVELRIYRPTAVPGRYKIVAESLMVTVPPATVATFGAAIPVEGGDILGLSTGAGGYPVTIYTADEGDIEGSILGAPALGQEVGGGTGFDINPPNGRVLNLAATISRPDPPVAPPSEPATTPGPATTGSTTPAPVAPPSNAFSLGAQHRRHGSEAVDQTVTLPGPGTLSVGGKGIVAHQVGVAGAGTLSVRLSPGPALRDVLGHRARAQGKARIAFTPTGGTTATQSETVTFRRAG
ncbi:MAG: hypothetical protein JST59_13695 [Actinobacteria bacterium]|nr:hypothetical protein [Actinomycetota bacterium]